MKINLQFDDGSKLLLVLILLIQVIFPNGLILFGGLSLFFLLFYNLQQPHKPSVFTIVLIYHFVQITAAIWQTNNLGKDLNFRSPSTYTAIVLSYLGLLTVFLPIIYFQNKIPKLTLEKLKEQANKISIDKTIRVYIISFAVINLLGGISFFVPALRQIIVSLGNLKWFMFLLFGYQCFLKNEKRNLFYLFCVFEFSIGFLSYFSDFKTVIFFIAIIGLTFLNYFKINRFILLIPSIIFFFYIGIFWTSIKGDYRSFLNKGTQTQTVQVDNDEAINKLLELSQKSDKSSFEKAQESFFDRVQYTYHFAKTIDRVPSVIPFQEGANLGSTLEFVLTPRILSPNKGNYDASARATKYTGIYYSGFKNGVSVSLGYFADCYIDFGLFGMFIPLLIFGFILGKSYFYFVKKSSPNYLFNFAVVGAIFTEIYAFESDSIFVFGRLYINLMVFFLLKHFLFPKLYKYLKVEDTVTIP